MKKFFSYKMHFVLLVILASGVSSVGMMMKSTSGLEQTRQSQIRSETIQKMNPFKRIVSYRIEELKSELLNFALGRKNKAAAVQFGSFNSVALIQEKGTEFHPKWIESDQKEIAWSKEYQSAGLKTLAFQKLDSSGFAWFKYQEGTNKTIYFSVFEIEAQRKNLNKKAYIVGMSLKNPLAGVADDYRGTSGKAFLLNDKAFVAAHTVKNYDGALFSADPIFQDIKSSKRANSSGSFVDANGESVFSYYEKLEHSNLYAVLTAAKSGAKAAAALQWQAASPSILGLIALFAFFAVFFVQKISIVAPVTVAQVDSGASRELEHEQKQNEEDSVENEFENLERRRAEARSLRNELMKKGLSSLNPFAKLAAAPVVDLKTAPLSKAETNEKSVELLKMMSRGLINIFSDRISSLIAESSLILAKTSDEEIKSHAKTIQDESRKSRELLKELDQFNLKQNLNLTYVNLSEVCEQALLKFKDQFEVEGIEIRKSFDSEVQIRASIERLKQAIEKVVSNSIEALKGREEKVLGFKIHSEANRVTLSISDNGIGMPKEIQEKIFLPFYRDFSNADGNGLGLSFVQGVVEAMNGDVSVQSSPGTGTEMILTFEVPSIIAPALEKSKEPSLRKENYEALKKPKLDLDFQEDLDTDLGELETKKDAKGHDYFELDENDLDQEFDQHLKELSDRVIQKKIAPSNDTAKDVLSEFNMLKDFETDDDDVDDFKVTVRAPMTKTSL